MLSQKSEKKRELVQGSEMSLELTHGNTHNLITRSWFLRASTTLSSHSCGNTRIFAIIIQTNKCLTFVTEKNVKTLNPFISTPADEPSD